jgi:ornithine cyclodeaminase
MAIIYNRSQLEKALRPQELIAAIEQGFVAYSQDRVIVPPVGELLFEEPPGDCHIKYGYVPADPTFTIKVATGFYRNPELGISSSNGIILVFSTTTG